MQYILGISVYKKHSSAALICDGRLIAISKEEYYTRRNSDKDFPTQAIKDCFKKASIEVKDLSCIAVNHKPIIRFDKLVTTYLATSPRAYRSFRENFLVFLNKQLSITETIKKKLGFTGKVLFVKHHEAHAALSFFTSSFNDAAILTIDDLNEWETISIAKASGNKISFLNKLVFPSDLAYFYSSFAKSCGFVKEDDLEAFLALSQFGEPKFVKALKENVIDVKDDGSFQLNMKFFNFYPYKVISSKNFYNLFKTYPAKKQVDMIHIAPDIAASVQKIVEEVFIKLAIYCKKQMDAKQLCLSGNMLHNSIAIKALYRKKIFDEIWIPPCPDDMGSSLGGALSVYYNFFNNKENIKQNYKLKDFISSGPQYFDDEIKSFLINNRIKFEKLKGEDIYRFIVALLTKGKVVGCFSGPMEFSSQALGARVVLINPLKYEFYTQTSQKYPENKNLKLFKICILEQDYDLWFERVATDCAIHMATDMKDKQKEFLIKNFLTQSESSVFDGMGENDSNKFFRNIRLNIVREEENINLFKILTEFKNKVGLPFLFYDALKMPNEPLARSPNDSYSYYLRTNMDNLILENYVLSKKEIVVGEFLQ